MWDDSLAPIANIYASNRKYSPDNFRDTPCESPSRASDKRWLTRRPDTAIFRKWQFPIEVLQKPTRLIYLRIYYRQDLRALSTLLELKNK